MTKETLFVVKCVGAALGGALLGGLVTGKVMKKKKVEYEHDDIVDAEFTEMEEEEA